MTIKEKIQNLVLNGTEDAGKVDEICESLKIEIYPKELLEDLFKILEKYPHY
jgi:hypothetical protein